MCDAGTRVIVIGRINDVMLYRELVRRGVSDYVLAPVGAIDVVRSVCNLFSAPEAKAVGRIIAIVGAKGGVGSSTVAHNVAWAIARDLSLDSVVADLDLAFGTAGLDYNQDPPQGIADAVFSPDRSIPRSSTACCRNAPTTSACWRRQRRSTRSTISARKPSIRSSIRFAPRCPASCSTFPINGRDGPGAPDRGRRHSDRRGARSRQSAQHQEHLRPAEGIAAERSRAALLPEPGRHPEAAGNPGREFAKAIENQPIATIPFDPQMFGAAANNGQMIAEISATHRTTEMFLQMRSGSPAAARPRSPRARCCRL